MTQKGALVHKSHTCMCDLEARITGRHDVGQHCRRQTHAHHWKHWDHGEDEEEEEERGETESRRANEWEDGGRRGRILLRHAKWPVIKSNQPKERRECY